jgi:hypothetical protein
MLNVSRNKPSQAEIALVAALQASASAGRNADPIASKKAAAINGYYNRLLKSGEFDFRVFYGGMPGSRGAEKTWSKWS